MEEFRTLFIDLVHEKLKEKIVGRVWVTIDPDDELIIEIKNYDDFTFRASVGNLSTMVCYGVSSDAIVDKVVGKYKAGLFKWIEHLYFR